MSNFERVVVFLLFIVFCLISTLFVLFFKTDAIPKTFSQTSEGKTENTVAPSLQQTQALLEQVDALAASSSALLERIQILEEDLQKKTSVQKSAAPAFQKQIIYIGSASTKEREWTDSGVEVTLDSADYPSNVTAAFEVGLSIVGGEAWARLLNKTTGAILAITEVSHASSTTTWKTSPVFTLHPGKNTYILEIKSSSGETASFSGARVVIE